MKASIDYMSPYYEIKLNGKLLKVSKYDIRSGRYDPLGLCIIEFPKDTVPTKGMTLDVSLGYREKWLWKVFTGSVDEVYPSQNTYKVVAKDTMLKLMSNRIVQSFINASPQDILNYGLKVAGIKTFELASEYFPKKNFNSPNLSVKELVEAVNRTWGTAFPFFFSPDEKFFWCDYKPKQTEKSVFEYGENIIDLEPLASGYKLTTVLVPYIAHSMDIVVNHPDLVKTSWRVSRIRWLTNAKGFPRTEIYLEG